MNRFFGLLALMSLIRSVSFTRDSTGTFPSNLEIPALVFRSSAQFIRGDALYISSDDLIYTSDDYAFRGTLRLTLGGTAAFEFSNEGQIVTEVGTVQRMKTLGGRLKIVSEHEYWPAVAVYARGTLNWLTNDYSSQTVKDRISYLGEQGMERFSYSYQYANSGITLSRHLGEMFEVTGGLGFQQFQLRHTTIYLTWPAPAESYMQEGTARINGVDGYAGIQAIVSARLAFAGEFELLPEPTPDIRTMRINVDRAVRFALGFRLFASPCVGVHANLNELIPAYGKRDTEMRMGIDIFLHKLGP
jgi:hypothetical protein